MGYLGVDVAKDSLEVAESTGTHGRSFPNTTAGIGKMLGWMSRVFPNGELRLIVEPTSTYHHPLVQALASTPPPQEDQEGLKALRRHVDCLRKELQAARNRLDTASFSPWTPQEVLDSLERTIQQLEEEIKLTR